MTNQPFNFDTIKGQKMIIGGLRGKIKVTLVGFDTAPDKNGNTNYKFRLQPVDYPTESPIVFNTSREGGFLKALSCIGEQLGIEVGSHVDKVEVLKKAIKEPFYIWRGEFVRFEEPGKEEAGDI